MITEDMNTASGWSLQWAPFFSVRYGNAVMPDADYESRRLGYNWSLIMASMRERTRGEAKSWWAPIEPRITRGGHVGGDMAAAESWSVRLWNTDVIGAVISIDAFAEFIPTSDDGDGDYGVSVMIEYMICTDRTDPGGTEIMSTISYDYDADVRAYATAEEADQAARRVAESYAATAGRDFEWDGKELPRA